MSGKRIAMFGWAESVHVQRWVRGLISRGNDIRLISLGGKPLDDVETIVLPRGGRLSYFTQARKAARLARGFEPDLVQTHYAAGFGIWARVCNFHPTVTSVWGADIIDFPRGIVSRGIVRSALRQADWITSSSNMLLERTVDLFPKARRKISVVPFGVEVPEQIDYPPAEGPVRLCFIKAHRPKYGPDILLQAFFEAVKEYPNLELSIAGQGEMTPELKRLTSALGLDDKVKFVGFVERADLYPFLQQHHIMVMPSIMESESFGVAVIEASACGLPVVASRIGGIPEAMVDGRTGLLVAPGDVIGLARAIVRLADDKQLRRTLGDEGRRFVKSHYDWERSLDLMSEIYERVVAKTRRG